MFFPLSSGQVLACPFKPGQRITLWHTPCRRSISKVQQGVGAECRFEVVRRTGSRVEDDEGLVGVPTEGEDELLLAVQLSSSSELRAVRRNRSLQITPGQYSTLINTCEGSGPPHPSTPVRAMPQLGPQLLPAPPCPDGSPRKEEATQMHWLDGCPGPRQRAGRTVDGGGWG